MFSMSVVCDLNIPFLRIFSRNQFSIPFFYCIRCYFICIHCKLLWKTPKDYAANRSLFSQPSFTTFACSHQFEDFFAASCECIELGHTGKSRPRNIALLPQCSSFNFRRYFKGLFVRFTIVMELIISGAKFYRANAQQRKIYLMIFFSFLFFFFSFKLQLLHFFFSREN